MESIDWGFAWSRDSGTFLKTFDILTHLQDIFEETAVHSKFLEMYAKNIFCLDWWAIQKQSLNKLAAYFGF